MKKAAYLASRVVIILEAYTLLCANQIQANECADTPPDQEFPEWDIKLPFPTNYPDDLEGWQNMNRSMANRIHSLKNTIQERQGLIYATAEYSPEDLGFISQKLLAESGLEAWLLAKGLRGNYKLGRSNPTWDYDGFICRALDAARKEEIKSNNARSISWSQIKEKTEIPSS